MPDACKDQQKFMVVKMGDGISQYQPKRLFWIILLLAIGVRMLGIASRPIWYDEAFAILFASENPTEMIYGTLASDAQGNAADVHPLLYYFLLWSWMKFLGDGIEIARLFSILVSLGTVIFAYVLSRDLFGKRTALIGMLLVALSPFQIHYAQEIRMYALMTALLIGAAWFCVKGTISIEQGDVKYSLIWWGLFSIFAALAQYTHNLSVFFLIPLFFTPVFWRSWRAFIAIIVASILAMLIYTPWLLQVLGQLGKISTSYWVDVPEPYRLLSTLLSYVTNLPLLGISLIIGVFATIFVFTMAAWQTIRSVHDGVPGRRYWTWLMYMSFSPVLLLFLTSQWIPVYIERALLPSGVMFLLWLAWVFTQTNFPILIRNITFVILLFGMLVGIYTHLTYTGSPYGPFSALNQSIRQRLQAGDVVIHSEKMTMFPMYYDDPSIPHRFVGDIPNSSGDTLALPTQETLGLYADENLEAAADNADRIWFIIFDATIKGYSDIGHDFHPHQMWMEENYAEVSREKWGPIWLYEYVH